MMLVWGCKFVKEAYIHDFMVHEETLMEENEILIQEEDYF
jgi:hypothetical protein